MRTRTQRTGTRALPLSAAIVLACAAFLAALAMLPAAALANPIVSAPTPLLEEPHPDAGVLLALESGEELTIDGAPEGNFYPVTAGGVSGWIDGAAMRVDKAPADAGSIGGDAAPASVDSTGGAPTGDDAGPAAAAEPAADAAPDPAGAPAEGADAVPPADEPLPTPVPAPVENADTAADDPAPVTEAADGAPAASPDARQPEMRRNGPAAVLTDAPLLESPDANSALVFLVPEGSTFNLYGDEADGYLYGEFMWMFGWIDASHLDAAERVRDERVPEDAETVDAREPKPGAGVARTTVDLTLRAGPSAAEDALGVVPAGTRIELTGVMQNDFQRVVYGDQVGWLSNQYLELPAEPEPEVGRNGRPEWTEREIIGIIEAAADRYKQPRADMVRVARCESSLDPYAVNPSGSYGLFQFVRSTWESTPFADEDIFDPVANANAAGWMWKQGRRAEWVCK